MATGEQIVSNQFNSSDVIEPSVVIRSCEPCSRDGSATKATVFCKVCKEILCDECSKPHTKYKPGRHDVVNIQDMGSAAVMVDMKDLDLCEEHGKAIKFYCEDHSKLCCSTCTFTHRKCDNVDEIKSISLINKPEFQATKHALIKIESEAASFIADCEKSRDELNESIANISDEGDKIKDSIVKLFEEAQQKMFTEINQFKAEVSMQLDKKYTAASQIQEQINQILPMYSAILEHGTFEQKFIFSKKTKEQQNTIETHVDSQRNATVTTNISLSFSRELQALLTMENPIFQMNFDQQCAQIDQSFELQIKLQEEIQKASQQMQMLELEISCLRGQLGEKDQMLTQYKEQLDSQQKNMTLEHQRQRDDLIKQLDHLNSALKHKTSTQPYSWDVQSLKSQLMSLIQEVKEQSRKLDMASKTINKKSDRLTEDAAKLQQTINQLQHENNDLKNRLRAVFGAKLQDNNPQIADLSDQNRATKLAERFNELYDNEWTDCCEVLTKQKNIDEKEAIGLMLQACLAIYQDCSTHASNDLMTLTQALDRFDGETDFRLLKDLKEKRKRRFQNDIDRLRQPIEDKMTAIFKETTNETTVAEFRLKCLELCWLMAIQDPPVSMDARTSQVGEIFDGVVYRPYTKSGRYVEFIVWPALRLTETGSLLYKGVAQGTNTYQQYSKKVDSDVKTDKQTSSKISKKYQNEYECLAVDNIKRPDNISQIVMGDTILENTKGQNNGTIPKHAVKMTGKLVCLTDESEMSQNQNYGNAEHVVPTKETKTSNKLQNNHNFDADGNQPVNANSLYKKTQPDERHSEDLSDVPIHNTSKQTETTDVKQSKQDATQPNKTPISTSTSVAQHDYGNLTQLNASRRKSPTGENNKMSGSMQKKENEFEQFLKTKNAPSAPHIENLLAGKPNMTQTVSANVQRDIKAQSVKGTSYSATVVKHTTSIPVGPSRTKNIPVVITQVI